MDSLKQYLRDYFLLDQHINSEDLPYARGNSIFENQRYRNIVAVFIPLLIVYSAWFPYMISTNSWHLFTDNIGEEEHPRWTLTIAMVFGSMIAGATSEGGAAIAFPVLTLALNVAPPVARDFSFLIQSVGMTAAAFSIWFMNVVVEWNAIVMCSIGGAAGVIFGLEIIDPVIQPAYSKMYFVSIWFSFAVSLFWVNYLPDRTVYTKLPTRTSEAYITWERLVLLSCGFLGGIFSSIGGSGIDICSFAVLTLVFRVSERVATPTSVILMAGNTVIAFIYRRYAIDTVSPEVYNLWLVCIPVVVIGAPLGAVVSSHFHKSVLAGLIYALDTVQLIGALYVVQPWTHTHTSSPIHLCVTSAVILLAGMIFFTLLAKVGLWLEGKEANKQKEEEQQSKEDIRSFELDEGETELTISPMHKGNMFVRCCTS